MSKTQDVTLQLLAECSKGSRKAENSLYRLYYKAMYNTSLRILRDPMEAEDAMQEAFIDAFRRLSTFNHSVTFGAWLRKIVINRSVDKLRENRKVLIEFPDQLPDETEQELMISDNGDSTGITELIYKTVQSLPEGYRLVLTLHLFEGLDHEEIAAYLGISASSSRSHYCRARKKLQEELNRLNINSKVYEKN